MPSTAPSISNFEFRISDFLAAGTAAPQDFPAPLWGRRLACQAGVRGKVRRRCLASSREARGGTP